VNRCLSFVLRNVVASIAAIAGAFFLLLPQLFGPNPPLLATSLAFCWGGLCLIFAFNQAVIARTLIVKRLTPALSAQLPIEIQTLIGILRTRYPGAVFTIYFPFHYLLDEKTKPVRLRLEVDGVTCHVEHLDR
jgi:hypothetical protein